MKFAESHWLFGVALSIVLTAVIVYGTAKMVRAKKQFGDLAMVNALVPDASGRRRALKAIFLILAVALSFIGLAQPQYGRGSRLIPSTNLDCVIVLDYSKSMYARDVSPSRTERAKAEVTRMLRALPGARFGAVAFAGEPVSFPLTSDSPAIAQFFRQLEPNDMPVGGTAIARAIDSALKLFEGDKSRNHRKVIVLVTDGEDLEGDPVALAQSGARLGVTIHVVQIGGRTPESIPEVDESGSFGRPRLDENGRPLMTSLSAEGEAQLTEIARVANGEIIRSERGSTGIERITSEMKRMMTAELSERVETVYADVYFYPVGLAVLLLVLEVFLSASSGGRSSEPLPPPTKPSARARLSRTGRRRKSEDRGEKTLAASLCLLLSFGCNEFDKLFERNSPVVDRAIASYVAADAGGAAHLLQQYLSTGQCTDGHLGAPQSLHEKGSASFDLSLALFKIGERYGQEFGHAAAATVPAAMAPGQAPSSPPAPGPDPADLTHRSHEVDCALGLSRAIAKDGSHPYTLRARAYYLSGNLEFLRFNYREAIEHYDEALKLIPAEVGDAGDVTGRHAAHNRAIAQRRVEDEPEPPDAGADAEPGDSGDGEGDGGNETNPDGAAPQGDSGSDKSDPKDSDDSQDEDNKPQPSPSAAPSSVPPPSAAPPPAEPPSSSSQDQRMLDMLEDAEMLNLFHGRLRKVKPSEDK